MLTTIIMWIGTLSYLLYPIIAIVNAILEGMVSRKNKRVRKQRQRSRKDDMELIRGDNGEYIWLDMRR